jgi:IBR domain, a half RING-finger domain
LLIQYFPGQTQLPLPCLESSDCACRNNGAPRPANWPAGERWHAAPPRQTARVRAAAATVCAGYVMDAARGLKRGRSPSRLPIAALLSAPTDPAARSCAACLTGRPVDDGSACDECATGSFCGGCLAAYVRAALEDNGLLPLRCGAADCRAVIPAGTVSVVVGGQLADVYVAAVREKERRSRRVRLRVEGGSSARVEGRGRRDGAGEGEGEGEGEAEAEDEGEGEGEDEDEDEESVLRLLRAEGWQRCPDCGTGVERVIGCRHMRCVCGGQFCYGCGGRWGVVGCARRCGFDADLAVLLNNPGVVGADSSLWEGLRDQIWRRMLRILQELHGENDGQRCRATPRLAAAGAPSAMRCRARRSRGLAVHELVHSVDSSVGAVAECPRPSLPPPLSSTRPLRPLHPITNWRSPDRRAEKSSHRISSLVLHNLDFLVHDRDQTCRFMQGGGSGA